MRSRSRSPEEHTPSIHDRYVMRDEDACDAERDRDRSSEESFERDRTNSVHEDGEDQSLNFDWKRRLDDSLRRGGHGVSELSNETWDRLESMEHAMACNVVKRLAESNLLRVRNLDGFTTSIIRRIEREGIDTVPADLSQLSSAVEGAIRKLADDALVNADDFAHPMVVSGLNSLADRDAIDAIEQFAKADLDAVRNKTGFMLSILRRVSEEGAPQRGGYGGPRGGRGGYGPPRGSFGRGGHGGGGYGYSPRSYDRGYSRSDPRGGGYGASGGSDRGYGGGGGGFARSGYRDRGGEKWGGSRRDEDLYERGAHARGGHDRGGFAYAGRCDDDRGAGVSMQSTRGYSRDRY